MPSTGRRKPTVGGFAVRGLAFVAGLAWVTVLFIVGFTGEQEPSEQPRPPAVTIAPIESYDSDDLRRVAEELAILRGTRLTPEERATVGEAAEIVESISEGEATIAPETTTTTTVVPAATASTTTASTTTTTTTTPPARRTQGQWTEDIADQLGVEMPDGDAGE